MSPGHLEATVRVDRQQADAVESLMLSQGALAVTLTDTTDTPILEPGVGETPLWEGCAVTGLFDAGTDESFIRQILSLALFPSQMDTLEFQQVANQAWERAWMDRFEPMKFGERLWIVPTGMECPQPDALIIHLDPGLAFGTGTHPTTRLCLGWLDGQDLAGKTVLDFGCGSGVLAIAAAILGARRVYAIDNDPQAVLATRENAARNGVDGIVEASEASETGAVQAQVVVANILAGTLVALSSDITASVRPGGCLALSGILRRCLTVSVS